MRLLSYNMLNSINNNHLTIEVKNVIEKADVFEPDYLRQLFFRIDWNGLVYASKKLGYTELPDEFPDASVLDSEEFLKKFHHALLELHLEEGALVCPETGRRYPVKDGVPNMSPDEMLPSNEESVVIEGTSSNQQTQVLPSGDKSNTGKKKKTAKNKKKRSWRNQRKQNEPAAQGFIDIDWAAGYKPNKPNVKVVDMSSSESSSDEKYDNSRSKPIQGPGRNEKMGLFKNKYKKYYS